jgi:hypothetical protein
MLPKMLKDFLTTNPKSNSVIFCCPRQTIFPQGLANSTALFKAMLLPAASTIKSNPSPELKALSEKSVSTAVTFE